MCSLYLPREERAFLFAHMARINILSMIACAGSGHIGTSFSCIDIVTWLYLEEIRTENGNGAPGVRQDVFFSSKGHDAPALYAVLVGIGLMDEAELTRLRRIDGLPGHPDLKSNHLLYTNTGSLGMGISKAKGMALAHRTHGRDSRIYVMTGDGELQEGQIWESLGSAVRNNLHEITVIVDHNKVQSDTFVADTADLGDLGAKFSAFGWHVQRCDGHDFNALASCLETARAVTDRPSVIVADTVKGRGVSFMEHTSMEGRWYRYHSGAPSAQDYERGVDELMEAVCGRLAHFGFENPEIRSVSKETVARPASGAQRLIGAYGDALLAAAEEDESIVVLDADLILDNGLIPFSERYPDRFYECGIAEQDMVSQAGGLALKGMLPIVHSFACFLTPRANEQIYNNATEGTKIIYVGSLSGIVPGGPGHSHQSVRDIALLGCIPDFVLLEPSCEAEVRMAVQWAVSMSRTSVYLRLVSIPCEIPFALPDDYQLQPGRGVTLVSGEDAVVFAYGPVLLGEAVRAAQSLWEEYAISVTVVNLPWLSEFDESWLHDVIARYPLVVTLDNHYVWGGQGERLAAWIARLSLPTRVLTLGLSDIPVCGRNEEVLRHHGLDSVRLVETIRSALRAA